MNNLEKKEDERGSFSLFLSSEILFQILVSRCTCLSPKFFKILTLLTWVLKAKLDSMDQRTTFLWDDHRVTQWNRENMRGEGEGFSRPLFTNISRLLGCSTADRHRLAPPARVCSSLPGCTQAATDTSPPLCSPLSGPSRPGHFLLLPQLNAGDRPAPIKFATCKEPASNCSHAPPRLTLALLLDQLVAHHFA